MTQNTVPKSAWDLIYLVSCAVNREQPDRERCAAMDLEEVWSLAQRHMLTAAAASALSQAGELPHAYDQALKKAIRKIALFDIERAGVLNELEQEGIWYLPLKGVVMKDLYPKAAMREMSDNDILCDPARMDDVTRIMQDRGYTITFPKDAAHAECEKPPTLVLEMHRSLFSERDFPTFAGYFADIADRLLPADGCRYGRRMTDEDFYLYLLCHIYKHYQYSGTGLRSLLDVYVFCRSRYDGLDQTCLRAELDKLDLTSFEEDARQLAYAVFTGQELGESETEELLYYLDSGSYGTRSQAQFLHLHRNIGDDDSKRSKRKYLLRRVFISGDDLKNNYPTVYRHKSLYPLLLIYRPIKGVLTHPKGIAAEYKRIRRYKSDKNIGSHNQ